ncbi:MAG TPA: sulfur oxidation c-type cytochrome SoxA [Azospirillaceae bacterium]|nr:sulfur oxidation c-type cytochrome SoxA [Azospirillaceae bacterium]
MDGRTGYNRTRWYLALAAVLVTTGAAAYAIGGGSGSEAGAGGAAKDFASVPLDAQGSAAVSPWVRYKPWPKTTWDNFNTLATDGKSPPPPEPGAVRTVSAPVAGDPEKGRQLAFDRTRGGGCVTCHVMGPKSPELPGNVGPDLSEIGTAHADGDEYLFNYIWDARVFNPETVMPPWGAHGYYSEEEVRHMVAFLKTLNTPASFKTELDDPNKRPTPVENRDWKDPFVNPAVATMEQGPTVFAKAGPNGKSCASCHADSGTFKGWAVAMPKWHDGMQKVIGVEEFVTRHARATMGADYKMQGPENTTLSVYLRSLSNGMPIKVDTSAPGAKEAAERGKDLMVRKIGQQNFACVDCHSADKGALKWVRGQYLGLNEGQVKHFPTWRTSRDEIWDIRKRMQWCNVQIRANELPPDAKEYGELELFLTSLSNGHPMEVPGIRH